MADKQLVLPHKAAAAPACWDEDEEGDDGFDLLQEKRVAVDQLEPRLTLHATLCSFSKLLCATGAMKKLLIVRKSHWCIHLAFIQPETRVFPVCDCVNQAR